MTGRLRERRQRHAIETRELVEGIEARGWQLADGVAGRLVGWMGRRRIARSAGLCLMPCRGVHTFFMRFPIDVVFLARDGTILKRVDRLPPGRAVVHPAAFAVLELPAGAAKSHDLVVGGNVKTSVARRTEFLQSSSPSSRVDPPCNA